ncbi:hypothetical protein B7494_g8641 [Chlorociboria aeruginascens]|nr:hypothetical protein B7494_g8641 [Chlorociboria aeruginascens]
MGPRAFALNKTNNAMQDALSWARTVPETASRTISLVSGMEWDGMGWNGMAWHGMGCMGEPDHLRPYRTVPYPYRPGSGCLRPLCGPFASGAPKAEGQHDNTGRSGSAILSMAGALVRRAGVNLHGYGIPVRAAVVIEAQGD